MNVTQPVYRRDLEIGGSDPRSIESRHHSTGPD
jgi:hypothetical protein